MSQTFKAELRLLQSLSGVNTYHPFYHAVADYDLPHVKHILATRDVHQFTNDVDFFMSHFTPVSLADIIGHLRGARNLPRNAMLLTVDDGMREVHDVMAPILREKGCPAVFFLCPPFLNNASLFWRSKCSLLIEALRKNPSPATLAEVAAKLNPNGIRCDQQNLAAAVKKILFRQRHVLDQIAPLLDVSFDDFLRDTRPFMTVAQVRSLIGEGFEVGAHSMHHPRFAELNENEAYSEASESIDAIANLFGAQFRSFAHPFKNTDLPEKQLNRLLDESGCPVIFGTGGSKVDFDRRIIQRNNIEDPLRRPAPDIVRSFLRRCVVRRMAGKHRLKRSA